MDIPSPSSATDARVRAALDGIAAAPEPGPGPDFTDDAIRNAVGAVDAKSLADLKVYVQEARARFRAELMDRAKVPLRLAALRRELERRGLAGMLVAHSDEYLGEYVALRSQRLTWLTGFTGSAGLAVVTQNAATILVDGRYTLQVREQVDGALFAYRHVTEEPASDWIAANLPRGPSGGGKLGYDPMHFTERRLEAFRTAASKAGGELMAMESNPIDAVWSGQPPAPLAPIVPQPLEFAGESHGDKRARIAATLVKDAVDAAVLTQTDSIAWLLNVRGRDVPNTPLPLSFAILHADATVDWFVDARKLSAATRDHVGSEVRVRDIAEFADGLAMLAGKRVQADPAATNAWVFARLDEAKATTVRARDPVQLPKAKKNATELAGARAAHMRDGAALAKFFAWLAVEAPKGGLDEIAASDKLTTFRAQGANFRGLSFDTISGAGPNGAVVHYRAVPETQRRIERDSLYLVDSGAQYLDGTTDVTRAVAIGTPTAEMRDRFTRVLKGHIQLALARFPEGTSGPQLDVLARAALWQAGVDYDHGTGHGVGSYLGVHEGPQGISARAETVPLAPGMIVSNEPGYYKTGAYGIRIENLVVVTEAAKPAGGEKKILSFEALTLAPIDRALVEPKLLTAEERQWLNNYHLRVRTTITPLVDAKTAAWLKDATAPI
jgi:Xaa-Pro aminopeptidase